MSIEREMGGRQIVFHCDSCPDIFAGEADAEFSDVWDTAKFNGWSAGKVCGEWMHGCPACGKPT